MPPILQGDLPLPPKSPPYTVSAYCDNLKNFLFKNSFTFPKVHEVTSIMLISNKSCCFYKYKILLFFQIFIFIFNKSPLPSPCACVVLLSTFQHKKHKRNVYLFEGWWWFLYSDGKPTIFSLKSGFLPTLTSRVPLHVQVCLIVLSFYFGVCLFNNDCFLFCL